MSEVVDVRADVGELEDFVENARVIVEEARLHFDEDGLSIVAVGPANYAMVRETLPESEFVEYHSEGVTVGADLGALADRLNMIDGEARIRFDGETRKMVVSGDGLRFDDGTIDPKTIREEPSIPDLDLPATAVLDARRFRRGAKAAGLVSDAVLLGAKEELKAFYMEGDGDTSDSRDALEGDDLGDGTKINGDCESLFTLEMLQDIAKAPGISGEITLLLGEEMPVKIHSDGLMFMIAPRIDTR